MPHSGNDRWRRMIREVETERDAARELADKRLRLIRACRTGATRERERGARELADASADFDKRLADLRAMIIQRDTTILLASEEIRELSEQLAEAKAESLEFQHKYYVQTGNLEKLMELATSELV